MPQTKQYLDANGNPISSPGKVYLDPNTGNPLPVAPVASTAPISPGIDISSDVPSAPSFWDRLTEIQKPDPNHPWDYHEALKAIGNIGAGGMGWLLHPLNTIASAGRLALEASPPVALAEKLMGKKSSVDELAQQLLDNPYGTVEAGIGQSAVAEALPRVIAPVARPVTDTALDVVQRGIRRVVGSGPGVATRLVRDAAEKNRIIDIQNEGKLAEAQQRWQEAQAKADADHRAELLRLRQKHAQDVRNAAENARTGTAKDRAEYQSKQLAAKQKYEQSVRDANEAHKNAVEKANQENDEAQRRYNLQIGQRVRGNRAVSEAQTATAERTARLQVGGSQLIYRLNRLDRALRDRAGVMFDAIREKVGDASVPGISLGTAARDAMGKISGTSVTPPIFRDILGKYPAGEPEFIEYQGAQVPKGTPLYDVLAQHGAVESPAVTYNDLQGYYSELGKELSKGTLPSDVYLATRALQESIGDLMQQMADKAGVGKQLTAARKFYRGYMDTFHEPSGPSGSGSPVAKALLAKDPLHAVQALGEKSGARGVAELRRYDDNLANLAQDLYRVNAEKVRVPMGGKKSIADIPNRNPSQYLPAPIFLCLPLWSPRRFLVLSIFLFLRSCLMRKWFPSLGPSSLPGVRSLRKIYNAPTIKRYETGHLV